MVLKYVAFQNLPSSVARRLEKRIVEGTDHLELPEDASTTERARLIDESFANPEYTEAQLTEIADAFTTLNNAVRDGLPNQLYTMFARALDKEFAQRAHAAGAIWYAHEDDGRMAKEAVQKFADNVKRAIDRRADWEEERFHKEYFLGRR